MKKITGLCLAVLALFLNSTKVRAQVALAFNGSSNYVSTNGTPVIGNQARTVDAWIKTTSSITTQMVICDWGVITPNASRFTMNVINNKLRIEVGGVGFTGTTNVNTGQWVHVTAVYSPSITSGANAFLYLNGNLEAAGSFTGYAVLSTTNTVGFRIGVRVDGINYFNGAVDEVKVYNYARTQAQVAADTLEYCSAQPGLVAYYKLNEGVPNANNTGSTTAIDYSGNGNNGTLNSFTLTGTTSNWVPGRVSSGASLISASPANYICSGNSVSLTTNASSNYTWSTGNTTSTLIAITPTSTGNYSVTVTNTLNNCTMASVITITVNSAPPTVTVLASQNPICTGASTSFSATGAVSYSWTGGIVNMQLFTPTVTTSYTLSAANACGVVNSVHSISVAPLPVTATAGTTSVCQGYTCNLTASAAATTYSWLPVSQTGSSIVVSPSSTTIYTVTASNGTCVGTQTLQLNTIVTPSVSINNSVVSICIGQTTSITASGAGTNGTYSWSPGAGNSATVVVNPTVTTLYTVYGTNTLG
ncbi:MAG: LamG domain-containing protein, partial [Bacteroidia bacterium]|nr:LamG domain-containing protein [Bacteroidia bacterium]